MLGEAGELLGIGGKYKICTDCSTAINDISEEMLPMYGNIAFRVFLLISVGIQGFYCFNVYYISAPSAKLQSAKKGQLQITSLLSELLVLLSDSKKKFRKSMN